MSPQPPSLGPKQNTLEGKIYYDCLRKPIWGIAEPPGILHRTSTKITRRSKLKQKANNPALRARAGVLFW